MNKKANRRAFFVCLFICLMYVSVAMNVPEKVNVARLSKIEKVMTAGTYFSSKENISQAIPETVPASTPNNTGRETSKTASLPESAEDNIEPALLISVPLVCFGIKEKLLEKEALIPAKKGNHNASSWKKPVEILNDKDEEGLKNIAKTIGIKHSLAFLKREGIALKEGLTAEEVMLGKGYILEKKKLLALYKMAVSDDYGNLFPFVVDGKGIAIRNNSFEFVTMVDEKRRQYVKEDDEWQMPNLLNLPIKVALERLASHTVKIKVHGSGIVTEQSPRAFERIKGEAECTLYGRARQP